MVFEKLQNKYLQYQLKQERAKRSNKLKEAKEKKLALKKKQQLATERDRLRKEKQRLLKLIAEEKKFGLSKANSNMLKQKVRKFNADKTKFKKGLKDLKQFSKTVGYVIGQSLLALGEGVVEGEVKSLSRKPKKKTTTKKKSVKKKTVKKKVVKKKTTKKKGVKKKK